MQAYADTLAKLRAALAGGSGPQVTAMLDILEEAITSRQRTEQDLKGLIADKDTEVARLRGEIGRLRHAAQQSEKLHEAHASEVTALQAQLVQAVQSSKSAERAAVLSAATPAASTPQGEVVRLQAELDARAALVARLEAELSAQAAAASARAAELQDSFALKVSDMRRMHAQQLSELERGYQQQLASAAAVAAAAGPQASSGIESIRQQLETSNSELASANSRLAAQQQALEQVTVQLAQAQADLAQAKADREQAARRVAQLQAEVDRLRAASQSLEARLAAAEQQAAAATAAARAQSGGSNSQSAAAETAAMVAMMEGQLARLSEIIRVKEVEIAELRQAVTLGLEERKELVSQLQALQSQAAAGGGPHGEGSPRSQRGSPAVGPQSPGAAGKPAAGLALGKPYRTGLHSKPKFK